MTLQSFRDLLSQRPFQPFRLIMSSGKSYEVRHFEMAFLTRTAMYIGVGNTDEGIPDDARICSLLHVSAVEPLNPTASPSSNHG